MCVLSYDNGRHTIYSKCWRLSCYYIIVNNDHLTGYRNEGNKSNELTKDHKPGEDSEKRRITQSGGQLYQNGVPLSVIGGNG